MEEHRYSTFTLDLHWLGGEPREPELEQHVATCDQCRAYVAQLDEVAARPLVLPAMPRRRWWPFALAVAVAIAVVMVVVLRPSHDAVQVAAKGAPAVQVLVRREGATTVWDASLRIRDRDALAVRVACEAMMYATVLVADRGGWSRAYTGRCSDDVLPFSLAVDGDPGDERIAVVLSTAPLDDAAARRAADDQTRSADVWTLDLVFDKELVK